MRRPSVVFDFDGTLALGHGPVLAYARQVAALAEEPEVVAEVTAALRRLDAGDAPYRDGYDAVRQVALAHGLTDAVLSPAYLASRRELGALSAPVDAAPGLEQFLGALATTARLVMATNAPETGVERVLESIGAAEHLSERHFSVGKPAGLAAIVSDLLADGPGLAVGDIWENDLAPAAALGADTALVGAAAAVTLPGVDPTLRGATLADLYSEITSWAASAVPSTTGTASAVPGPTAPTGAGHLDGRA
ncbi:MAG: HAD family hydrolase [Actinomycetales bacterium]